jgi:hypothetical protein
MPKAVFWAVSVVKKGYRRRDRRFGRSWAGSREFKLIMMRARQGEVHFTLLLLSVEISCFVNVHFLGRLNCGPITGARAAWTSQRGRKGQGRGARARAHCWRIGDLWLPACSGTDQ